MTGNSAPAPASRPLRLGFPVKVTAKPGLKSNDTRRWQKGPHLKTSLEYAHRILDHLQSAGISMYRLSSDLAPYATHPDMPQFHGMVRESAAELAAFGARARELDIRLSFHPSQYILLNSPSEDITQKSIRDLASQAEMLDRMELGPEAVVVTHVGGVYGDARESRARWIEGWNRCPEPVKRRLVLENDDIRFSAADVLWLHGETGVRLIFDYQHFWCLNPERLPLRETLEGFLRTWPEGVRPKIHFSSPRTELREIKRAVKAPKTGTAPGGGKKAAKASSRTRTRTVLLPPVWTGHADFINPFEFASFMRMAQGLEFDVMLESKMKDFSLLKLRPDLLRYAPDAAERFGILPSAAALLEAQEAQLEEGVPAEGEAEAGREEAEAEAFGAAAER